MKPPSDTLAAPEETPAEFTNENPAVGIDQSVGDFTYDVKY